MVREALVLLVFAATSGLVIATLADGIVGREVLPIQPLEWLVGLLDR